MLKEQSSQVRLGEKGEILYQSDPSNPLPGVPVAVLKKGPAALRPEVELLEALSLLPEKDKTEIREQIRIWLVTHIATVLEPLVALESGETLQGAAKDIAEKVYDGMGIVPREQLESLIATLDPEGRKLLRDKKIRLGPVLVFQPDLNKPVAVRLRALLWAIYNNGTLPVVLPHDGAVSMKIDPAAANRDYYQSIGYPVYATRAIRIDMLDRVISAVYDGAKDGKFQAQHKMAEWLGCSIPDLYEVLIAMGHIKISDPAEKKAEEKPATETTAVAAEAPPAEKTEEPKAEEVKTEAAAEPAAKPAEQARPELATFRLKKGKAFAKQEARAPRAPRKDQDKKKEERGGEHKKDRKDFKKDFKKGRKPDRRDKGHDDREPRIVSSTGPKPKPEDSPFAILEQLRVKKDAG